MQINGFTSVRPIRLVLAMFVSVLVVGASADVTQAADEAKKGARWTPDLGHHCAGECGYGDPPWPCCDPEIET